MDELGFLGASVFAEINSSVGELRHLHSAFDSHEDARSLLLSFLPASTSSEFVQTAVGALMQWKRKTEPLLKRQRKMHLDLVNQTLLSVGEPASKQAALEFEEIIRSDPKVFLEAARRTQKRSSAQGTLESRADREDRERKRFALELASIVEEACLPVSLQIISLDKPELAWLRIWGSRRAKTLRNRFRAWTKFRSWLLATYGVVWPKDVTHVVNFIEELIDF
eukprot:s851_g26.t1